MSIDINWETLTQGAEGEALAETIRSFIHDKFQQVTLPKFIRSVKVHSFDFGTIAPDLDVKDVCDPLPDFYDSEDGSSDSESPEDGDEANDNLPAAPSAPQIDKQPSGPSLQRPPLRTDMPPPPSRGPINMPPISIPPRTMTPRIPGGTSNMNYFHQPLSGGGLSGAATPLAAMAPRLGSWADLHQLAGTQTPPYSTQLPATIIDSPPSPPVDDGHSPNDVQIISHLRYSGDVRMSLTAEVHLDYPMQNFVGIPLKLNVTGLTFDGVAILAYIRRKVHFCFLAPEDADALVGSDKNEDRALSPGGEMDTGAEAGAASVQGQRNPELPNLARERPIDEPRKPVGGLFEEIRVESEIGQKQNGKQVLKNVGKVEKFILEQVRRIFENEFVYPSFWTFLT